jgi:hypothetical protein
LRFLEGEAVEYKGILYLVKGYQHPEGFLVAYPRYDLLTRTPLQYMTSRYTINYEHWDCVKHTVPLIPLSSSMSVVLKLIEDVQSTVKTIVYLLEVSEDSVNVTGSSLVSSTPNDVDIVIYGATESIVERLSRLVERGVLEKSSYVLMSEYLRKHNSNLSIGEYMALKRNTLLHFTLRGLHVNLKLVELNRGYQGCVDPVFNYRFYTGLVEVFKPMNPHIIPARYSAKCDLGDVVLESLRELYAELTPGVYYAENARIEVRKSGLFLVPDHGVLRPLSR